MLNNLANLGVGFLGGYMQARQTGYEQKERERLRLEALQKEYDDNDLNYNFTVLSQTKDPETAKTAINALNKIRVRRKQYPIPVDPFVQTIIRGQTSNILNDAMKFSEAGVPQDAARGFLEKIYGVDAVASTFPATLGSPSMPQAPPLEQPEPGAAAPFFAPSPITPSVNLPSAMPEQQMIGALGDWTPPGAMPTVNPAGQALNDLGEWTPANALDQPTAAPTISPSLMPAPSPWSMPNLMGSAPQAQPGLPQDAMTAFYTGLEKKRQRDLMSNNASQILATLFKSSGATMDQLNLIGTIFQQAGYAIDPKEMMRWYDPEARKAIELENKKDAAELYKLVIDTQNSIKSMEIRQQELELKRQDAKTSAEQWRSEYELKKINAAIADEKNNLQRYANSLRGAEFQHKQQMDVAGLGQKYWDIATDMDTEAPEYGNIKGLAEQYSGVSKGAKPGGGAAPKSDQEYKEQLHILRSSFPGAAELDDEYVNVLSLKQRYEKMKKIISAYEAYLKSNKAPQTPTRQP